MTIWAADDFEYTEIHDSVEDLVAALHGEPTNAELNRWGLYRAGVARHYHTAPEPKTTQGSATQAWSLVKHGRIWPWRHVIVSVVLGVALWLALWWALKP